MSKYSWLIFDADGTLFDYDQAEFSALSSTLEQYGGSLTDGALAVYRDINSKLWKQFEEGAISSERLRVKRFEDLATELGLSYAAQDFSATYLSSLSSQCHLMADAQRIVNELSRDFGLVLATNGIAEVQRSRFSACAIRPFFSAIVISDEVGVAKPAAGFFEHLFQQIGSPAPTEVLMVGDGLTSDIQGAVGFGIDSCWFNPAGHPNDSTFRPTYEISKLADLPSIVRDSHW